MLRSHRRTITGVALGAFVLPLACSDERGGFVEPTPDAEATDSGSLVDRNDDPIDSGQPTDATTPEVEEVDCQTTPCAVAIAARGGAHVCALLSDGTVTCWGADAKGQLGIGGPDGGDDPQHGARPTRALGVSRAKEISTVGSNASGSTCARLDDGTVMCWGANDHGQLALGGSAATVDGDLHPIPTRITGLSGVTQIGVSSAFGCAVVSGGDLDCWGHNSVLQLGRGPLATSHAGIGKVSLGLRSVIAAAGTRRNAFAISNDGELLSWGGSSWDVAGTLRDALGRVSSLSPDGTPTPIPSLGRVTNVSAGDGHVCAIAEETAYCWGKNPTGAVGNGTRQDAPAPYAVTVGASIPLRQISVSQRTTCARTRDGEVYCWGDNADGQLGGGNADPTLYPVLVQKLGGRALQVATMDRATCALLRDGAVTCWGSNANGELGLGQRDDLPHHQPAKVAF
jgi:alpha-tubulin suppressor-like RCC1 family protein